MLLEGDTRVVFYVKNANKTCPGNIVIRANDSGIVVILTCNIHLIKSDGQCNPEHNYQSSRVCISIVDVQNVSSLLFFSLDRITHLPVLEKVNSKLCL